MKKSLLSPSVLMAVFSVAAVGVIAWPYTVDDAYIVARYAERIVDGKGYTMSDGKPTDGITGPLWVVPAIGARLLGISPVLANKAFGLVCMVSAVLLLSAGIRGRAFGRITSWIAFVVFATQPTLGIWAVAGLETGAAALAFAVAITAAFHRKTRSRPVIAGMAIACLAWLRPEMALCSAIILAVLLIVDRKSGVIASSIAAFSALGVIGFRFVMFGTILPLAFYAKPAPITNGFRYTTTALIVTTSGIGIWLAWLGSRRGRRCDRVMGAALIAQVLAVIIAGGDWMPDFRLFAPIIPEYAILVALGIGALIRTKKHYSLIVAALVGTCMLPAFNAFVQLPEVRSAGAIQTRVGRDLAGWLSKNVHRVALVDIGYIGYKSGVDVVDLGGITDPVVANYPGGHISKRIDIRYLKSRNPDAIVFHSDRRPVISNDGRLASFSGFPVEQRVAASDWFKENFRFVRTVQYTNNYFYTVLARISRP
jgi:arabinofuranosyltransferase